MIIIIIIVIGGLLIRIIIIIIIVKIMIIEVGADLTARDLMYTRNVPGWLETRRARNMLNYDKHRLTCPEQ